MSVQALMVDVDGVLIRHPDGRTWHSDLQDDLGIDPGELDRRFFRVHFDDVITGRADLFDRLDSVLPEFSPVSATELVSYWFERDATLDNVLLTDLGDARRDGLEVHLATVQEHHRARFLWESLGLRDHFDGIHYAADVGVPKSEPLFYGVVESRTQLRPKQHCLIDDSEANVQTARDAGWHGFLWLPDSRLTDVYESF